MKIKEIVESALASRLEEVLITFGGKKQAQFGNIVIMAGGAGSGKGLIKNKVVDIQGRVMDVDKFKELAFVLPKLRKKVEDVAGVSLDSLNLKNPDDVSTLHFALKQIGIAERQQSAIGLSILAANPERKPNLVFDVTLSSISKLADITNFARDLGYKPDKVHIVWVIADIKTAAKANKTRPRTVADDILRNTHAGVLSTMKQLLSDTTTARRFLDGAIYFAFNRRVIDTEIKKSKSPEATNIFERMSTGTFVANSVYFKAKEAGKKPITISKLDTMILHKLRAIFPKGSF